MVSKPILILGIDSNYNFNSTYITRQCKLQPIPRHRADVLEESFQFAALKMWSDTTPEIN